MLRSEPRRAWTFTLYHDDDENAAVDQWSNGHPYLSEEVAIDEARGRVCKNWQSATVEVGDWHPAVLGVRPAYWDERETIAYIGPDGSVERVG